MDRAWIALWNQGAVLWSEAIGRACWQGGGALLLVWVVGRALPCLTASACCWLWRLAFLKMLVALFWPAPISLPLLPPDPLPPVTSGRSPVGSLFTPRSSPEASATSPEVVLLPPAPSPQSPSLPPAAVVLLLLWAAGVGACARAILREWREGRRLERAATPLRDGTIFLLAAALARRLGLRRTPKLKQAAGLSSPLLIGVWRPVILLPPSPREPCDRMELRLILAHELAHAKRRDLLWGWLPALTRALLFFHPLVWLAQREWNLAQEMACDALALRTTRASAAAYGDLLLKVAARSAEWTRAGAAIVGAMESSHTLARRLKAMSNLDRQRRYRSVSTLIVTVSLVALVPWRLTARAWEGTPPAATMGASPRPVIAGDTPSAQRAQLRAILHDFGGTMSGLASRSTDGRPRIIEMAPSGWSRWLLAPWKVVQIPRHNVRRVRQAEEGAYTRGLAVLTEAQRARWRELVGEPFPIARSMRALPRSGRTPGGTQVPSGRQSGRPPFLVWAITKGHGVPPAATLFRPFAPPAASRNAALDRLVSSASFLLLPFPSVKADLKIDARQEEPLAAALLAWGQRMSLLESLPPTERQARQQRVQSQTRRQVAAILTPRQKRRLYQIELQTAGAEALVRDEVNRALGLVWKQRVEIRSAIYGYETWGRELVKEIEGPDRDTDLLRDLQETKQKAYERAVAVLTDSQRVAWREMIGPRFDLHAVMIPAKLRESRPGPAWYFFFSPRSAPAPTNLKEETRDWVHEWLSPPSNMNPFLFFHRLIVDRIVSVHVSVMTTGDGRVLVSGKPTAVETFKAGLRVGDARVERLDDRTSRAVLSPEKARVDELRAALLSLPDAGTVVTRDHELVLEGRRAWVKQAVLAVVRAEMEAAQPPAAAPSPV